MISIREARRATALEEYQLLLDLSLRVDRAAFVARYSDLSDLSRDLNALDALHGDVEERNDSASTPLLLSDFEVIREIGRGGMGAVYEARQRSLDRTVAVKVLSRSILSDHRARQRFLHEARVVALLPDANIVPIYHVGEERGTPYLVLRYIDGGSLRDALQHFREHRSAWLSLPDPGSQEYFQRVAKLVADAASALAVAHTQGVVHRDIKPSNLLVDRNGTLWVSDFGLALGPDAGDLTRTDERPGTLRYMSPEQLNGPRDRIDGRSDIFSLGATLYELTTLRALYEGDSDQLLARMVSNRPSPRPRIVCPNFPRDLETIVLKATAEEPLDRYATASEFAEDLRRFADGEPIRASRAGIAWRVWRWLSRHRRSAAVAAVAVIGLIVAFEIVRWRAYRAEVQARAGAERSLAFAFQMIRDLGEASDEILTHAPGLQSRNLKFLEQCRDSVKPYANDGSLPVPLRREIASLYLRLSMAYKELGNWEFAEKASLTQIGILEQLVTHEPHDAMLRFEMARAWMQLPHFDDEEQLRAVGKAIEQIDEAHRLSPDSPIVISQRGDIRTLHADLRHVKDGSPVLPTYLDVAADYEKLRERYPVGHPLSYMRLAFVWVCIGHRYVEAGSYDEADQAYRKALAYDEHIAREFANEPPTTRANTRVIRPVFGSFLIARGRHEEGERHLIRGIEDFEDGVRLYPTSYGLRCNLMHFLADLAYLQHGRGQLPEARATSDRCLTVLRSIGDHLNHADRAKALLLLPVPEQRDPAYAARILSQVPKPASTRISPWLRALCAFRNGQTEAALSIAVPDADLRGQLVRAACFAALGRAAEARATFEKAANAIAASPFVELDLRFLHSEVANQIAALTQPAK